MILFWDRVIKETITGKLSVSVSKFYCCKRALSRLPGLRKIWLTGQGMLLIMIKKNWALYGCLILVLSTIKHRWSINWDIYPIFHPKPHIFRQQMMSYDVIFKKVSIYNNREILFFPIISFLQCKVSWASPILHTDRKLIFDIPGIETVLCGYSPLWN